MTSTKAGNAASERVAINLKRTRKRRDMTTYELSDRLGEIGWPMGQSTIVRIENGQRGVDVDDLVALAVVLGVSPNRLLMPDWPVVSTESAQIEMTLVGKVRADTRQMWRWARGVDPLDCANASEYERAAFRMNNQPDEYGEVQHELRTGDGDGES